MAYSGNRCSQKGAGVVVSDVEIESEFQFERRMFGATPNNYAHWRLGSSSKGRGSGYGINGPILGPISEGQPSHRRLLNQAANAAVKVKGSIFEIIYRRCVPRLGRGHCASTVSSDLVDPA
jgi:hypothetical protein